MSSRGTRMNTRSQRREQLLASRVNGTQSENQQGTGQAPVVPPVVSGPPMIDLDAIEDDDDVLESTASAFAQAKSNSAGARRGPVIVYVDSGRTARVSKSRTRPRSDQPNGEGDERSKSRKSKAVVPVEEEPKFNCPICMCPWTEETSTKCGHIFCNGCIKKAISCQAKCPTCRKKVTAKDLIRIFLPNTR